MRDVVFGGAGLVVGGIAGVVVTLAAEAVIVAAVLGTVWFMQPTTERAPVQRTTSIAAPKSAGAGEVQLFTTAAVVPLVDGVQVEGWNGTSYVMPVAAGTHRLQLLDMLGREVASQDFVVKKGRRTQLRWSKKVLDELGQVPMQASLDVAPVRRPPVTRAPAPSVADRELQALTEELGGIIAGMDAASMAYAEAEAVHVATEAAFVREQEASERSFRAFGAAVEGVQVSAPTFGRRLAR